MCCIREDKQSSFRPREPEMSDRALGDWMVIRTLLIFTDWRLLLTIGGFQYHKSPRGSILISNGLRQRNPPNEIWALTRASAKQPWRLAREDSGMHEDANTKARSPSLANVSTIHILARNRTQTNTSLETPQLFWEEYLRCRRQSHSNERETKHKQNKATVLWKNAVRSCAHTHSRTFKYSHT